MTTSVRYLRYAAFICLALAVWTAGTVLVGLFDPPPWNRVGRAAQAWAWFYIGYLHWRLAKLSEPGDVTDSGHRIGDPCEAIVAQFVYGPQTCMKRSVATASDPVWGTTHVVCGEHAPRLAGGAS